MINKNIFYSIGALILFIIVLVSSGCERDVDILEPATFPKTPEVFIDGFSAGLSYAAFGGSDVTAFDVDTEVKFKGTASMKFAVPDFEDPAGAYAGGAYFTSAGRDLSGYDALTFWAKASKSASIDVVGFGNDVGEVKYPATILGLSVNSNWKKYAIPIPDPSKLTEERGMFYYSEGPEEGKGYTFWIDEVKFEKLGTIAHPRPAILEEQDQSIPAEVGDELTIGGTFSIFNMPSGIDQRVEVSPAYFNYSSSDITVATVNELGTITVIDSGTAVITAKLAGIQAKGSLTVEAVGARPKPLVSAPLPTRSADSVISMFSNAYTNVAVDVWNTYWQFSTAQTEDIKIGEDDVKLYTNLNFVGIEFASQTIDATNMTHFHLDIWTPDPTNTPKKFNVLLVDFGADGKFDGGDDKSHEVSFTSPILATESWVSLDIPLSDFTGLTTRGHLAQLVLSGDLPTVYLDNVYFYNDGSGNGGGNGGGSEPTQAAPTPTNNSADVISVFSDAYTNIDGTNFYPDWGQNTVVSEESIAGNNTLLYSGMNYQGIELSSSQDLSSMEYLHVDYWTANSTDLNIYLISDGPVEEAFALTVPTNGWGSVDIPLGSFSPVDLADIIQLKFDGNGDIYLDNLYFYKDSGGSGGGTEPTQAAPTPSFASGDVISLFSNAYTNVTVDTWSAEWDVADFADVQISGNDVKLYTNLSYAGIEFTSETINASEMTHFHIDVWTPDATTQPAVFKIKLVDFGANGVYDGGGDDTEHEVFLDNTTTPSMGTGNWINLNIPLTDFVGLTTKEHVAQLIISGDPNTVYIDNVLFHK